MWLPVPPLGLCLDVSSLEKPFIKSPVTFCLLILLYFFFFIEPITIRWIKYSFFFLNLFLSLPAGTSSLWGQELLFVLPTVLFPLPSMVSGTWKALNKCYLNKWVIVITVHVCSLWAKHKFTMGWGVTWLVLPFIQQWFHSLSPDSSCTQHLDPEHFPFPAPANAPLQRIRSTSTPNVHMVSTTAPMDSSLIQVGVKGGIHGGSLGRGESHSCWPLPSL